MLYLKNNKIYVACLFVLLVASTGAATADIYKYRDSLGRTYLTDEPMRGDVKLLKVYRGGQWQKPGKARSAGGGLKALNTRRARLTPLIDEIARETRVRADLLHAVVRAESGYDHKAVSTAGATGLMQLMPATAKRYGVTDRTDPEQNLRGGALYLRDLLKRYKYNLRLALAAYNAGENAVERYGFRVPPYKETRIYVGRVIKFFNENRRRTKREQVAAN